jgi:hypothetical protein
MTLPGKPVLLLSVLYPAPAACLQTWWNCWNNGINTNSGNTGRRCSTYRNTVLPAVPSADCLSDTRAQFNDYNYAFSGLQGESGQWLQDIVLPHSQAGYCDLEPEHSRALYRLLHCCLITRVWLATGAWLATHELDVSVLF